MCFDKQHTVEEGQIANTQDHKDKLNKHISFSFRHNVSTNKLIEPRFRYTTNTAGAKISISDSDDTCI